MGALIAMIVPLGDDGGRRGHRSFWGDTWPDAGRARGQHRVMDVVPHAIFRPGSRLTKPPLPSPNISHDISQLYRNPIGNRCHPDMRRFRSVQDLPLVLDPESRRDLIDLAGTVPPHTGPPVAPMRLCCWTAGWAVQPSPGWCLAAMTRSGPGAICIGKAGSKVWRVSAAKGASAG